MLAALLVVLLAAAAGARLGDVTRREQGDLFTVIDDVCSAARCAEHGAGAGAEEGCSCVCPQRAPLFREDRELCVDDLPECSLATFGSGVGVQKIPFVFLPLKGQIIHPSKEIVFQGVKTPICAVSGAQFLTRKGFVDLRNTLDADVPFNLFRDEGRTFLQWSGEEEVRDRMSGRVMVVRLLCRDIAAAPATPLDLRGVFTPCVAFRVQGTPPRQASNVTEVQFSPNAHTADTTASSGLSVTEYVAIGISSLLLGLIYVASVFLYLHIRKRRKVASEDSENRRVKGLKKKDGSNITERDIIRINNERTPSINNIEQDDGVVKTNPLLNRQFHDGTAKFTSESAGNFSDSDDLVDGNGTADDSYFSNHTSAIVHQHRRESMFRNEYLEQNHRDESGIERLPDEHVSIVETIEDREISRPVGTTRRKLYFNPAYFEPNLMADPPQAALEFLVQIREVIAMAKHKMSAKRYLPILNQIPEEETYSCNENNIYQGLGSQRSGSVVSLKRENSRKKALNCVGCPGCKSEGSNELQNLIENEVASCSNCMHGKGEKQISIRRWLENLPPGKTSFETSNAKQCGLLNSLLSLPVSESKSKIKKQNSFSATNALFYSTSHLSKKSSMTVRSEPSLRNHNLPLPDFHKIDYFKQNKCYGQTISKVDDIRPIGMNDYRSNSLRMNPIANHRVNKFITNKNALPDMVNEAIALDHNSKFNNASSSDDERLNNKNTSLTSYTISRTDSPGNDYETDSLERTSQKKGKSTPTDFAEFPSSQASPSLSTALPLDEELTMRNAVYKTHSGSNSNTPSPHREVYIPQNHYETIGKPIDVSKIAEQVPTIKKGNDYSLVSEVYVNNNYNFGSTPTSPSGSECSIGSRKLMKATSVVEELPGCLTIEVKDSPENYIKIHESDGFEPDTLDRKHKELKKQKEALENIQFSRRDLLKNIKGHSQQSENTQLSNSGTFTNGNGKVEFISKFSSLRNSYDQQQNKNSMQRGRLSPNMFSGSKSLENVSDDTWEEEVAEWATEEGRILTLELRHSKRQRQSTPPTIKQIKNLARPDILPPLPPTNEVAIYEHPSFPPRKVESIDETNLPKNDHGRSLSPRIFTKCIKIEPVTSKKINHNESYHGPSCSPMRASVQSHSSDYDDIVPFTASQSNVRNVGDTSRVSSRRRSTKSNCNINTNTFVKSLREDSHSKARYRRKKYPNIEDSGYLSSDSTSSRQVPRKIVVAKIVSGSESDDTENEARSESGAESVETHSVYFGSFRNRNLSTLRDSDKNHKINK